MKKKERLPDTETSITQTGLQCPNCGEIVVSLHRHDFCQCGCGDTFIDGGFDYIRAGAKQMEGIKHVTVRISCECLRYKKPASKEEK